MGAKKRKQQRKTVIRREVIEGDIKRVVRTTKTTTAASGRARVLGRALRKAAKFVATDAEPADVSEEFGMDGCRGSMANGFDWVSQPCVKIISNRLLYFNAPAISLFGLRPGTLLMLSLTASKGELRFRSVRRKFANTTRVHREGCYTLVDASTKTRCADAEMVRISVKSKCGISLLGKYPGLVGHIFVLRQHPADHNLLVAKTADGVAVDRSTTDKLCVHGDYRDVTAAFASIN